MTSPAQIGTVVLATLALAAGVSAGSRAATSESARPATRGGTLFGMNVPSLQQLDASTAATGVRPALVGTFADWAHSADFPRVWARAVNKRGAVPLISWEPWDSWRGGADQPLYSLHTIAGGLHDALIDRWAREIAAYRRPVMLRFAPEMNGDWLPWSTGVNGNRTGDYVAAWHHVRLRFLRAGARNAIWVWNPTTSYDGSTPLALLFPGRRQVDWVAVDGYNWGSLRSWGWQSYADIFASTVRELRALAPSRPAMIAEVASAPDPRRPAWIADTLRAAQADGVAAVVWFEFNKETDWRLAADPASAEAARVVLRDGRWAAGGDLKTVERLVERSR